MLWLPLCRIMKGGWRQDQCKLEFKEKTMIGLHGLGCVTHPEFIRNENMIGFKTGLYEVTHPLAGFEVRDPKSHKISEALINFYKI